MLYARYSDLLLSRFDPQPLKSLKSPKHASGDICILYIARYIHRCIGLWTI